jgi:hypothetical protein
VTALADLAARLEATLLTTRAQEPTQLAPPTTTVPLISDLMMDIRNFEDAWGTDENALIGGTSSNFPFDLTWDN